MFKKKLSQLVFSLLLVFSSSSNAVVPVSDITDLAMDIGSLIEETYSAASDALREVSDRTREAYALVIKTQAVQTTINTYKNFMEAVKIYNKTKRLLDIVTGNADFTALLRVAGDRDVREVMGRSWSDNVDLIGDASSTFSGTDRRIRSAMRAFERGEIPYNPDLIYINPRFREQKEEYEEKVKRNKTYAVLAESNLDRTEEDILSLERMEDQNSIVSEPRDRDLLRNAILIRQSQDLMKTNNALERMNAMQNAQITEETQRQTRSRMIAYNAGRAW